MLWKNSPSVSFSLLPPFFFKLNISVTYTDCVWQMHEYAQLSANILSQNALKRSPHQHLAGAKRAKRPPNTASMVPQK